MLKKVFKKTKDVVTKTQLYVLETLKQAAGNTSALMELTTTSVRTSDSTVFTRNAAVDIAHAVENYACSDYKCLFLDTAATICDFTGAVSAFVPRNVTKKVFGVSTSASCFCRALRNKCKETNAFGCK